MIKKPEKVGIEDCTMISASPLSNQDILRVEGLKKYFPVRRGFFQNVIGWIKAVDGVELSIDRCKTLGLVGESGCGKSTIGQLILKLIDPDGGG